MLHTEMHNRSQRNHRMQEVYDFYCALSILYRQQTDMVLHLPASDLTFFCLLKMIVQLTKVYSLRFSSRVISRKPSLKIPTLPHTNIYSAMPSLCKLLLQNVRLLCWTSNTVTLGPRPIWLHSLRAESLS